MEIKDYKFIIDGQNVFDEPVKNDMRTYDDIQKLATWQGHNYTTGCLLDCPYFNEHFELIAMDLSKQQALDVDPKVIQKINLTGNLFQPEGVAL